MLKSIVFENFVHFKDKTTIKFNTHNEDATTTNKIPNQNSGTDENCLDGCHALNIFVGANFCGKSTVIELIRRCMTDEINVSVTSPYNKKSVAYALCQFSLYSYGNVISGIINEPRNEYKFFIFTDERGLFMRSKSSDSSRSAYNGLVQADSTDSTTMQAVNLIFQAPAACKMTDIEHLLNLIKDGQPNVILEDEPSWKTIEKKYVATFPMRGIGSVQWTRSTKIGEKKRNYDMACERAEVLSTLLSEKHKNEINDKLEREIFQFITYPEVFHFHERKGCISVEHNKSVFPLLKTSEGILEAKLTSLLLAHKDFHTLCLEDPDRGMHPQMIERLKTMLHRHRAAYNKTIVVVTHSPYFIDPVTIDKTHVFSRQMTKKADYTCSVTNALQSDIMSSVSNIETLRVLLFATKVLLVEGVTDREVVQGIFTKYKSSMLARRRKNTNYFWRDITTYQIIPLGGFRSTTKVQKFCKLINLPCCCVWDLDTVVQKNKKTNRIVDIKGIDEINFTNLKEKYDGKEISTFVNCDKDFDTVSKSLESKHIFIWRYGAIEDAILETFKKDREKETTFLGESEPNDLKKKLKQIHNENDRQTFYDRLMELSEIKRFVRFLKTRENMKLLIR